MPVSSLVKPKELAKSRSRVLKPILVRVRVRVRARVRVRVRVTNPNPNPNPNREC